MKRLTKTFLTACSVLAFLSCKKNIENLDTSVTANKSAYSKIVKGDTIVHKLSANGYTKTILEVKGEFYISDDMLIPKERFEVLKSQVLSGTNPRALVITNKGGTYESTWPNGIVYFSYPVVGTSKDGKNPLTEEEEKIFKKNIDIAIANISASTGIIFKERTNQISYLKYQKHSENNAWLGYYKDYANAVNIAGIERVNTIMHETLHALGIRHEHQRNDRDNFIRVDTSQVKIDFQYAFDKNTDLIKYNDYGVFDFQSIMLYDSYLGVKSYYEPGTTIRRKSMTRLDSTTLPENKPGLSAGDIAGLRSLYPSAEGRIIEGTYTIKSATDSLFAGNDFPFITDKGSKFLFTRNNDNTFLIQLESSPATKTFQYNPVAASIKIEFGNSVNISLRHKFRLHRDEEDVNTFTISPAENPDLRLEFNQDGINVVDKIKGAINQKIKLHKQ